MSKLVFIAMLAPEPEGGFSVTFPSVPGAISEGDSLEQAVENARDALETVLEDRLSRGEQIADDADSATALSKRIAVQGAVPTPILIDRPAKAARVNLTFDEKLLSRIDSAAEASGRTRSGFLADAARIALATTKI